MLSAGTDVASSISNEPVPPTVALPTAANSEISPPSSDSSGSISPANRVSIGLGLFYLHPTWVITGPGVIHEVPIHKRHKVQAHKIF
jgi:hypothetical protein